MKNNALMSESMTVDCPAKVNLFLAVTGRRADGFHELSSLVSPLQLSDTLTVTMTPGAREDRLECDTEGVPLDASNLVLRASAAFRERVPSAVSCHFLLQKKIPHGAGLGGGSSNAAAALRAINRLHGEPLSEQEMEVLIAPIGSDCPLFLREEAVVIEGAGERVIALSQQQLRNLHGRRLALFKPALGVPTAWAYAAFRDSGTAALCAGEQARGKLQQWLQGQLGLPALLFNSLQPVVTGKYLALAVMLQEISARWQLPVLMSGSGSACFALLEEDFDCSPLRQLIDDEWGEGSWFVETRLQALR